MAVSIGADLSAPVLSCVSCSALSLSQGVIPFWAFLERVERVPLATATGGGGAGRPGLRERRLASVRNTVGAVASLGKVSTPLGRARAWIRQCLACKCLEACVAALLDEERLVKVRRFECLVLGLA